jgi:hypothetical protein
MAETLVVMMGVKRTSEGSDTAVVDVVHVGVVSPAWWWR